MSSKEIEDLGNKLLELRTQVYERLRELKDDELFWWYIAFMYSPDNELTDRLLDGYKFEICEALDNSCIQDNNFIRFIYISKTSSEVTVNINFRDTSGKYVNSITTRRVNLMSREFLISDDYKKIGSDYRNKSIDHYQERALKGLEYSLEDLKREINLKQERKTELESRIKQIISKRNVYKRRKK